MIGLLIMATVGILGVSAGALVTEACVLVPFWRSLPPESFLAWYRQNARLLLRFFGPLEVGAVVVSAAAAVKSLLAAHPASQLLTLAAGLSVAVLVAYPMYFQRVNASFSDGSIAIERVAPELGRWSRWHWARTAIATAAFAAATMAAVLAE